MAKSIAGNESDSATGTKSFIPLENNPEVMSSLLHQLGFPPSIGFHDIYSIDEPDLLAFVPRPAYAVLLIFPVNETQINYSKEEDKSKAPYDGSGVDEEVIWFKQTIKNACGLIGLLHAASNGPVTKFIQPKSDLRGLLDEAIPLKPHDRAELLYKSQALETAHETAAQKGDTCAPSATDDVDLHYVCFVKSAGNNLWEMDGQRAGPINRGPLSADEDALSDRALQLGVRNFLNRETESGGQDLRFSLIALCENFD